MPAPPPPPDKSVKCQKGEIFSANEISYDIIRPLATTMRNKGLFMKASLVRIKVYKGNFT